MAYTYSELQNEFGRVSSMNQEYVVKHTNGKTIYLGCLSSSYPGNLLGYMGFMHHVNENEWIKTKIGPEHNELRAVITKCVYDENRQKNCTYETIGGITNMFFQDRMLNKQRSISDCIEQASISVFLGKGGDFSIHLVNNPSVQLDRDIGRKIKEYLGITNPKIGVSKV